MANYTETEKDDALIPPTFIEPSFGEAAPSTTETNPDTLKTSHAVESVLAAQASEPPKEPPPQSSLPEDGSDDEISQLLSTSLERQETDT